MGIYIHLSVKIRLRDADIIHKFAHFVKFDKAAAPEMDYIAVWLYSVIPFLSIHARLLSIRRVRPLLGEP